MIAFRMCMCACVSGEGEGFVGEGKSRLIEYTPFQDDPAKVAYLVRLHLHRRHPSPCWTLSCRSCVFFVFCRSNVEAIG